MKKHFNIGLELEYAAGRHQSGLKVLISRTLYKEPKYKFRLDETQMIAPGKQTRRDKRMKRRTMIEELG